MENTNFRSAVLGFDRSDVIHYIENISREHREEVEAFRAALEKTRADLERSRAKVEDSELRDGEIERMKAENAALNERLREVMTALAASHDDYEQLHVKHEELSRKFNAEEQARVKAADIEMQAHKKAREIEEEAKREAQTLRSEIEARLKVFAGELEDTETLVKRAESDLCEAVTLTFKSIEQAHERLKSFGHDE